MPSPPSYPSTFSPLCVKGGIRAKSVPLSARVTPDRSPDKPKAALQRKTRFRGLERVGWMFTLAASAYNLVRMRNLQAANA